MQLDRDKSDRDAFTTRMMRWAEVRGLLIPEAPSLHAATNYVLTARAIAPGDDRGCAELLARYMLIVAAGDDGVFDRVLPGEGSMDRRARLRASARYLCDVLRDRDMAPPRELPGSPLLASIARGWREILAERGGCAAPAVVEGFRRALIDLYEASVREHEEEIRDDPALSAAFAGAPVEVPSPMVPRAVRAWADELAARGDVEALRVVSYLMSSGNTIGAGLIFRAAALITPARAVTDEMASTLDAVSELANYRLRIDNDLSEIEALGGDRDAKETSLSVLLPKHAPSKAAVARAIAVVRGVGARLDVELSRALADLERAWPAMARLVGRALHMGRRTYEEGHYKTISHEALLAIEREIGRRAREVAPTATTVV